MFKYYIQVIYIIFNYFFRMSYATNNNNYNAGLCKYRNALGVPGKGVHSIQIGGIAIMDVVFTIIGAYFISRFAHTSFAWTTAGLFFLGIILHRLFCVRTTIDKLIFPNAK